jgi:hypothetical protein
VLFTVICPSKTGKLVHAPPLSFLQLVVLNPINKNENNTKVSNDRFFIKRFVYFLEKILISKQRYNYF